MPTKDEKGIVVIFPVVVVAAILLLSFTYSSYKNKNTPQLSTAVLSESSTSDDDEDSSGSFNSGPGFGSSGSGGAETPRTETRNPSATPNIEERRDGTPAPFFTFRTNVTFRSRTPEPGSRRPSPFPSPRPNQTVRPERTHEPEEEREVENNEIPHPTPSGTPHTFNFQGVGEDRHIEEQRVLITFSNDLPISVDENTSALTVTTPNGDKTVSLLPEDAIENILGSGSVNEIQTDPETGKNNMRIVLNQNGVPVYEVEGIKQGRFLGVFNVSIKKTVQISAIDGAEGSVEISGFNKFLDLLSF